MYTDMMIYSPQGPQEASFLSFFIYIFCQRQGKNYVSEIRNLKREAMPLKTLSVQCKQKLTLV